MTDPPWSMISDCDLIGRDNIISIIPNISNLRTCPSIFTRPPQSHHLASSSASCNKLHGSSSRWLIIISISSVQSLSWISKTSSTIVTLRHLDLYSPLPFRDQAVSPPPIPIIRIRPNLQLPAPFQTTQPVRQHRVISFPSQSMALNNPTSSPRRRSPTRLKRYSSRIQGSTRLQHLPNAPHRTVAALLARPTEAKASGHQPRMPKSSYSAVAA